MDWGNIIGTVITGIAVSLVLEYVNSQANKNTAPNEDGLHKLRLNKLYQIVGIICSIIGFLPLFCWAFFEEGHMFYADFNLAIGFLTIFGGVGLVMLFFYQNHYVQFDDDEIFISSWTKAETTFLWEEIEDISFNSLSSNITIKSFDKIGKINYQMVGLRKFITVMEEKTKWTAKELKLPIC